MPYQEARYWPWVERGSIQEAPGRVAVAVVEQVQLVALMRFGEVAVQAWAFLVALEGEPAGLAATLRVVNTRRRPILEEVPAVAAVAAAAEVPQALGYQAWSP